MTDENNSPGAAETGDPEGIAGTPAGEPEIGSTPWSQVLRKGCLIPLAVALLPLFALHTCIGGWPVNYGAPVRGRVIDGHTGKPVAGAVVVGEWYAEEPLGGQRRMHASETISDSKGNFLLPGMPLKIRRPFDHYETYDPLLAAYKPGYAAIFNASNFGLKRMGHRPYSMAMKRVSYWDGKDWLLTPVDDIKGEAEALARIEDIAMAGHHFLHPRRFPHLWSRIVEGARRIPEGQFKYGYGNPEKTYNSLMRKSR